MPLTVLTPPAVLTSMLRNDATAPRLTCYDDTGGPTRGERIELSAKVLANWVAKAANLLQDEFDVSTETSVLLDLPPHWRTAYWALAIWSVGATVVLPFGPDGEATGHDLLDEVTLTVTDDPTHAATADPVVLVTLAALARSATVPVPPGAMDEAKELATFPDAFAAYDEPAPGDPALLTAAGATAYDDLVRPVAGASRTHLLCDGTTQGTEDFLRTALAVWAGNGSLVLTRGAASPEVLDRRNELERATLGR